MTVAKAAKKHESGGVKTSVKAPSAVRPKVDGNPLSPPPKLGDLAEGDGQYKSYDNWAAVDLEMAAHKIAVDVAFFLAEEIDELNTMRREFRSGLEFAIKWTLGRILKQTERCLVIPDGIPGFTLLAFKKPSVDVLLNPDVKTSWIGSKPQSAAEYSVEAQAVSLIVGKFLDKRSSKILAIETNDILFTLFAMDDMRRNLREMGLYYTD